MGMKSVNPDYMCNCITNDSIFMNSRKNDKKIQGNNMTKEETHKLKDNWVTLNGCNAWIIYGSKLNE